MKKSTGKTALLLGLAAMGMHSQMDNGMPLVGNSGRKIERQKSQLTPKQKKARAKTKAAKKARKIHRKN